MRYHVGWRGWLRLFAIIAAVLLVDQVTKRIVVDTMGLGESRQPLPALYPFFQFTYSQNTGVAFGMLPQAGDLFLVLAVVVVIGLIFFYPRIPTGAALSRVGVALVCGGALGNALDRLEYGAVIDFIHYQIPGVISNVSNLADHAIVLGVGLILVESWFTDRQRQPDETQTAEPLDSPK